MSSMFWWPFAIGAAPQSVVEEDQVFYLCDRCAHELTLFMDVDMYMLKGRMDP